MFKDLVKKNRSYRGYDESRKITREELADFADCARFAPSSVNRQPFRYYLAHEQAQLDAIQPLTGWARALPEKHLPYPGKRPTASRMACASAFDASISNGSGDSSGLSGTSSVNTTFSEFLFLRSIRHKLTRIV